MYPQIPAGEIYNFYHPSNLLHHPFRQSGVPRRDHGALQHAILWGHNRTDETRAYTRTMSYGEGAGNRIPRKSSDFNQAIIDFLVLIKVFHHCSFMIEKWLSANLPRNVLASWHGCEPRQQGRP